MERELDQEVKNRNWLLHTPATDVGFLGALERASKETINSVLQEVAGKSGHKTRELSLRRRLRQMQIGKAEEMLEHDSGQVSDEAVVATVERQERAVGLELATLKDESDAKDRRELEQSEREQMIAKCHQVIGRIQGVGMMEKLATVANLVWLRDVKDQRIYKDIPGVGTWDKFCDLAGVSRRKVDEDLQNLGVFGESFLATVASLQVGYRELRRLRQLAHDGTVTIEGEVIRIGEEVIPINEEHSDELQAAIEEVLATKTKLSERVEKLEKRFDAAVEEETKGLKAEVKSLVKEVKRLKPFDPEEKDRTWAKDQMEEIQKAVLEAVTLMSRFIMDERVSDDPVLMGQVEGHLQTAELALQDLRDRWGEALPLFED